MKRERERERGETEREGEKREGEKREGEKREERRKGGTSDWYLQEKSHLFHNYKD